MSPMRVKACSSSGRVARASTPNHRRRGALLVFIAAFVIQMSKSVIRVELVSASREGCTECLVQPDNMTK